MKKILLLTTLVAGVAVSGFAQERQQSRRTEERHERIQRSPEERAKRYTETLDRRLNLSDKQEREVYQLQLKEARNRDKRHQEMVKRREKEMKGFRADREAREKKLSRILTEQQREIYAKQQSGRKQRLEARKEGRDGNRAHRREGTRRWRPRG